MEDHCSTTARSGQWSRPVGSACETDGPDTRFRLQLRPHRFGHTQMGKGRATPVGLDPEKEEMLVSQTDPRNVVALW